MFQYIETQALFRLDPPQNVVSHVSAFVKLHDSKDLNQKGLLDPLFSRDVARAHLKGQDSWTDCKIRMKPSEGWLISASLQHILYLYTDNAS